LTARRPVPVSALTLTTLTTRKAPLVELSLLQTMAMTLDDHQRQLIGLLLRRVLEPRAGQPRQRPRLLHAQTARHPKTNQRQQMTTTTKKMMMIRKSPSTQFCRKKSSAKWETTKCTIMDTIDCTCRSVHSKFSLHRQTLHALTPHAVFHNKTL